MGPRHYMLPSQAWQYDIRHVTVFLPLASRYYDPPWADWRNPRRQSANVLNQRSVAKLPRPSRFSFCVSVVSRILLNVARNRLGRRDPVIERSTDESMLFRLQRFLNPSSQHGVSRYLRRVYLFAGITLRNREVWLCTRRWAQECEGIYQMQEVEG